MALLTCPKCGNKVSDKASKCPKCGHPVSEMRPHAEEVKEDKKASGGNVADSNKEQEAKERQEVTPQSQSPTINPDQEKSGRGSGKIIALCAAVALVIAAVVFLLVGNKKVGTASPAENVNTETAVSNNSGTKAEKEVKKLSTNGTTNPVLISLIENMVYVDGGTFTMGAEGNQVSGAENDEYPPHKVIVSPFYMAKYPVTQKEFEAVMGYNPSLNKSPNNPVENVDWNDCQAFVESLNKKTGLGFTLPTEAEWEFAARGGNLSRGYRYSGSDNIDEVAWIDSNSGKTTHTVGSKKPNELGLYDMSGNVWEWCLDGYDSYNARYGHNSVDGAPMIDPMGRNESDKIGRGGSCLNPASFSRVANRDHDGVSKKYGNLGFRIALRAGY